MASSDSLVYKFDCGCEVKILDPKIKECDGLPSMEIDFYNLRMDCPVAWELISSGKTKGMFQLEGSLGKHWSKKTQPCSILELSALISVIRPGVLKSLLAGKSMTQHYADRKSGEENVEYPHPATTEILEDTYGIIIYQESCIALAKHLAGFSLVEADSLRKAIGKKDPELMQKCKDSFIIGCEKAGLVNNEDAEIIFDIIEKSNRYSFNKCWALDTFVQTPNGNMTLDGISIGDMVLAPTSDCEDGYVEVVDKIYNGEKELFEVTTETGKIVTCTIDHKLMCEDEVLRPLFEIIRDGWRIMCQD
jgi:Bacterial DNA polymerase III alpha subunit finger domain